MKKSIFLLSFLIAFVFASGQTILSVQQGGTGIGTYTVGNILYANGTKSFTRIAPGSSGQILTFSGGVPVWADAPSSGWKLNGNTNGLIKYIGTNDNYALPFYTNGLERIRILNSGQVGIGTTTPGALFDVHGNALINGVNFGRGGTGAYTSVANIWITTTTPLTTPTGTNNVSIGNNTLENLTTGSNNIAIGPEALQKDTSGFQNTAVGEQALTNNLSGYQNAAFGNGALLANTTGYRNTALGDSPLASNTTGQLNTAIGSDCMELNVTGQSCTAIGAAAMQQSRGNYNTGVGAECLLSCYSGTQNTGIGFGCFDGMNTGSYNTGIGVNVFYHNSGDGNVGIGNFAGFNLTGQSNVFVLDNQNRTTAANDTAKALMSGKFNADEKQQTVRINAFTTINSVLKIVPITATQASALVPEEGMVIVVSTTNGTFTAIGMWLYIGGAWTQL